MLNVVSYSRVFGFSLQFDFPKTIYIIYTENLFFLGLCFRISIILMIVDEKIDIIFWILKKN